MKKWAVALALILGCLVGSAQPSGPIRPNYHWLFVDTDPAITQACTSTQEVQAWFSLATGTLFTCQNGVIAAVKGNGGNWGNITGTIANQTDLINGVNNTFNLGTLVNVRNYGAKGDCSTDDEPAVAAAQTAALAYSNGFQSAGTLFFPKTSGGCYYFANPLPWAGVGLLGQQYGLANLNAGGVTIKGAPGKDIIHGVDPNTSSTSFHGDWSIKDISFVVDDTVSTVGLFPHRFPGRFFDTVTMTSGSAILNDVGGHGRIGCGDIGQAVSVAGAGPAGATLVTTIASVNPCWAGAVVESSIQTVTLAATASTSVTNAHTYISINGYPVTYTMGNAAIALDNFDGTTGNWVNPGQHMASLYNPLDNVNIGTVDNGSANGSIGIFVQGNWSWYGTVAHNVNLQRLTWSMWQGCAELNSINAPCMNDLQSWSNMKISAVNGTVTYDGLLTSYQNIQFDTQSGPQYLALQSNGEGSPDHMKQSNVEFENASTVYGTRYTGQGGEFFGVDLAAGGSQVAYFDSANVNCFCNWIGTLQIGGYGNRFEAVADETGQTLTDLGKGNYAVNTYVANPSLTNPPSMSFLLNKSAMGRRLAGVWSMDFAVDGNNTTPYNRSDFMLMPSDFIYNYGSAGLLLGFDAASPTGQYINFTSLSDLGSFNQFVYTGTKSGRIQPGVNFPSTNATVYFNATCGGAANLRMQVEGWVGAVPTIIADTGAVACSASYQNYSVRTASLSGYDFITFKNPNAQAFKASWIAFVPDIGNQYFANLTTTNINGRAATFAGAGAGITTGPTSSTADHIATFNDTTGRIKDSGSVLPSKGTTTSIGGGALVAGACASGTLGIIGFGSTGTATASPNTYPGDGFYWVAYISAADTVTVKVCAAVAGTPTASTYRVVAWQ
jgi:hypothetical protein